MKIRLSRRNLANRILNLPKREPPFAHPGLILIQIDGFSKTEFERALQKGEMPFIKSILDDKKHHLLTMFSGVPSVTPSVQGELLFGVKTCVPSFNFFDRTAKQVMTMYDRDSASVIEKKLELETKGLLAEGSSYCNILTGSAKEPHFCAANWGVAGFFHGVNPLFLLCYIDQVIRSAVLVTIELCLSVFECIRGTLTGWRFSKELELIWVRVLACILMREVVTLGTCLDIARCLPAIHLNFIGYDEQAHRRGPASSYAHWSLPGIDACIRKIFRAAGKAPREYSIWIFSDHGQHRTTPYPVLHQETLKETIVRILKKEIHLDTLKHRRKNRDSWMRRQDSIVGRFFKRPAHLTPDDLVVTDMGPEAHVYFPTPLNDSDLQAMIEKLLHDTKVPLAMVPLKEGKVAAWTRAGRFVLPDQLSEIIGADHPFLPDITEDLMRVCHHPNAGDFILSGWCKGQSPIAFPFENGSHGGMGVEETKAFVCLPKELACNFSEKKYIRPIHLWELAQKIQDKK